MAIALVKQKAQGKDQISITRPTSDFGEMDQEMDQLIRRVEERAFNLFQQRGGGDGFALGDWFQAEREIVKSMPIQVEETDNEVIVHAEVPGFEVKDLSIRAEPNSLSVYGKVEKKTESEKGAKKQYSEISTNEVYREIPLPARINPDKANAHLKKGMLEVRLTKATQPKAIESKAS